MSEEKDIYRQLQQRLDDLPVGFPTSNTGLEIDLLKKLFTPKEAEIATKLGFLPEPVKKIHSRVKKMGMSLNELEIMLDDMVQKGLILGGDIYKKREKGKGTLYGNALYGIGIHAPEQHVGFYDDIRKLVENSSGPFAIGDCICRKSKDVLEAPCKATNLRETCITLEEAALNTLYLGYGRKIKKDEMLEILTKSQNEGLILQTTNAQRPLSICACCGDCCDFLTALKKLPRPSEYFTSNFYSEVDQSLCEGCGTCIEKCQMGALTLVDNISHVNLNYCIGCGNCASNCPSNAIRLVKKSKEYVPPKDYQKLYMKILLKRKGLAGSLKVLGKLILRKPI